MDLNKSRSRFAYREVSTCGNSTGDILVTKATKEIKRNGAGTAREGGVRPYIKKLWYDSGEEKNARKEKRPWGSLNFGHKKKPDWSVKSAEQNKGYFTKKAA